MVTWFVENRDRNKNFVTWRNREITVEIYSDSYFSTLYIYKNVRAVALADPWLTCSCVDNQWPTEPVRVTGVTDVVIPAVRSWPDHDLRRWLLDPSSGMASPCDTACAVFRVVRLRLPPPRNLC